MLSALLGAVSATMLPFAPSLVESSSNLSNNDGNITSVRSAYYDASQVAEYGTNNTYFYNYSSSDLTLVEQNQNTGILFSPNTNQQYYNINGGSIWFLIGDKGYNYFICEDTTAEFDLYLDGVYNTTLTASNINDWVAYHLTYTQDDNPALNRYFWLFDHQSYVLGTDTVGDIAGGLTSGIGTIATGIGGGLQSLMQNIFLVGTVDADTGAFTATGLSNFGIVTVVFCGLALALGLCRWVVGFASSLGSRNR